MNKAKFKICKIQRQSVFINPKVLIFFYKIWSSKLKISSDMLRNAYFIYLLIFFFKTKFNNSATTILKISKIERKRTYFYQSHGCVRIS